MQDFLTVSLNLIVAFAAVYFAAGFACVSTAPKTVAPLVPTMDEPPTQDDVDEVLELLAIAAAPLAFVTDEPIELAAVETFDWASLSATQLRKECSAVGIKWRNAHPLTGKHLKKSEMVAALELGDRNVA